MTRALKMPLLKDYLLIHVDCSNLSLGVRNELFMASRDRLKSSDTADAIRKHLRDMLLDSEMKAIANRRKASLNMDGSDAEQMLRDITRNVPMNYALIRILRQTFDLPDRQSGPEPGTVNARSATGRDASRATPHPSRAARAESPGTRFRRTASRWATKS